MFIRVETETGWEGFSISRIKSIVEQEEKVTIMLDNDDAVSVVKETSAELILRINSIL